MIIAGSQKVSDWLYENVIYQETTAVAGKPTVVIDSGHGGWDPGKIAITGVLEKDINLKIATKLKNLLEAYGIKVVMTRTEDTDTSQSKAEDMKRRVEIMNESQPQLCISIHQNSYSDSNIHGAQVFYYTHSTEGEKAAEILQKALLKVDEDNTRQKKANDTYYILKKAEPPVVIVECGFLSNKEEAELLNTDEYQQKIAEAIAEGAFEYLSL
ncbi:MAG: N-acetylmuramoyl-L-alanine amidase [Ruminococcus sp.]|nr:N-acetylmuramoyl-L-alanine amidase [Ruminococcus sp.]